MPTTIFFENQSRETDLLKMKAQDKELEVIQARVDFLQKERQSEVPTKKPFFLVLGDSLS